MSIVRKGRIDTHRVAEDLMGKLVRVLWVVVREEHGDGRKIMRTWVPRVHPGRTGWVVGVRRLAQGIYQPASGYGGSDYEGYEPACLETTSTVPVLLVSFWPNERPVFVPLNGYAVEFEPGDLEPPFSSAAGRTLMERNDMRAMQSKIMREEVKKQKRGPDGRWLPEGGAR